MSVFGSFDMSEVLSCKCTPLGLDFVKSFIRIRNFVVEFFTEVSTGEIIEVHPSIATCNDLFLGVYDDDIVLKHLVFLNKMGQKGRLYVEYVVQSIRICAHLVMLDDKEVLTKLKFLKLKNFELYTDSTFAHYNFNPYPMFLEYKGKKCTMYIAPGTRSKFYTMPLEDMDTDDTWFLFPKELMVEMFHVINCSGFLVQEGDVFCANKEIYQPWPLDYLTCVKSTTSPGPPKCFAGSGNSTNVNLTFLI